MRELLTEEDCLLESAGNGAECRLVFDDNIAVVSSVLMPSLLLRDVFFFAVFSPTRSPGVATELDVVGDLSVTLNTIPVQYKYY